MPKTHEVRVSYPIKASQATIWQWITDHQGMPAWSDQVREVQLIRDGSTPNGLGAQRKIIFKLSLIQPIFEEVVHWDAPREYHYVLYQGMPGLQRHFGKMKVTPLSDDTCTLTWEIDFIFKPWSLPWLISGIFIPFFRKNIHSNVLALKKKLETT
ncbi:MAG: SRPBCC family protein [Bacteroidia bacterium]|nr:SRPBCC family protein [Bacteroidia bacterium]